MTSVSTNDMVSRFISALIPTLVAECARRISQIEKFGHSNQTGDYDLMRLTEQVSADMVKECDFDFEESDEESSEPVLGSAVALGISTEHSTDLTPVQNLKLDLLEMFKEVREKLIAEVKDSIKEELRMELFLELTTLKTEVLTAAPASGLKPAAGIKKEFGTAVLPNFSLEIGSGSNVAPVLNGFDSIASATTFGAPKVDVEQELLANNPLFARVAKNLDRAKQGKAMYTPEEVISARGNRFEKKEVEQFQLRVAKSKYEFDSDDEAEDSRWDQLLKEKLQAGL